VPEYFVTSAGVITLAIYIWAQSRVGTNISLWEQLHPALDSWPTLPLWGVIAFVIAVTPAFTSPKPPSLIDFDVESEKVGTTR
jgi:hypothetical protein